MVMVVKLVRGGGVVVVVVVVPLPAVDDEVFPFPPDEVLPPPPPWPQAVSARQSPINPRIFLSIWGLVKIGKSKAGGRQRRKKSLTMKGAGMAAAVDHKVRLLDGRRRAANASHMRRKSGLEIGEMRSE